MARGGRPRSFDDHAVVTGAEQLFWQHGYARTSMRDLTTSLGVLPGSLYGAFGDKHALFLLALQAYAEGARQAANALLASSPVLPRLGEFLTDVLRAANAAPGRGCFLGNTAAESLPGDDSAGRVVRDAFRDQERAIAQALELAQRSGEIRNDIDTGAHARLLLTVMQGLHVLARTEDDPLRLQDAIQAALEPLKQ